MYYVKKALNGASLPVFISDFMAVAVTVKFGPKTTVLFELINSTQLVVKYKI